MINDTLRKELQIFIETNFRSTPIKIQTIASTVYRSLAGGIASADIGGVLQDCQKYIKQNGEKSFSQTLFRYIDEKQMKDSDVYHRAQIDRKHFSKIRIDKNYRPSKNTVLRLAIALELDKQQVNDLLGSAGYALSNSIKSDLIVLFFLDKGFYNLNDIDETIYEMTRRSLKN